MEWKFITPGVPHQNGCAEALVKSAKIPLKKAIGEQILTPFELHTCLLEVSNLMSPSPTGRISNYLDDGHYLCPNDMLLGRAPSVVQQGLFRDIRNPRNRVEFIQKIVDTFWRHWTRDVFPALFPRKKWNTEKCTVRVDDIVTMQDSNSIRGLDHWQNRQ